MSVRMRRVLACLVVVAALAAPAGCGTGKPPVVAAQGKVMFRKTTPAEGALVVFHPANPEAEKMIGGKPFATVQADGNFSLTTFAEGDGAPEGDYGVTIDWRGKPKEGRFSLGGEGSAGPPKLHPRFGDPQKPAFKVTVKKGQPNEFTFDVE